jgi:hypothetical protein
LRGVRWRDADAKQIFMPVIEVCHLLHLALRLTGRQLSFDAERFRHVGFRDGR